MSVVDWLVTAGILIGCAVAFAPAVASLILFDRAGKELMRRQKERRRELSQLRRDINRVLREASHG